MMREIGADAMTPAPCCCRARRLLFLLLAVFFFVFLFVAATFSRLACVRPGLRRTRRSLRRRCGRRCNGWTRFGWPDMSGRLGSCRRGNRRWRSDMHRCGLPGLGRRRRHHLRGSELGFGRALRWWWRDDRCALLRPGVDFRWRGWYRCRRGCHDPGFGRAWHRSRGRRDDR